jgi:trehalose/maltose hydrolase-like predicted phosphorylase
MNWRSPRSLIAGILVSLSLTAPGCRGADPAGPQTGPRTRPGGLEYSDPWTLGVQDPEANRFPPYLGNGYLGLPMSAAGSGWDGSRALPAYVAGLYVNEALIPLPSPTAISVHSDGAAFGSRPQDFSDYSQRLSLREGRLTTRATWRSGGAAAEVSVECLAHRSRPHLVLTRARVRNSGAAPLTVEIPEAGFDEPLARAGGEPAAMGGTRIEVGAAGTTRVAIATRLLSPPASAGGAGLAPGRLGCAVARGQEVEVVRLSAVFTSADGADPAAMAARAVQAAAEMGLEALEREHAAAWATLWQGDIEIAGDAEAQAVVRACRFYLLESARPEIEHGVPPMGLSSNAFSGHVFWDMDSWMLPAVLPQSPALAGAMLAYRRRTLSGAIRNARDEGHTGAAFAWESAATGRERGPEPYRHGRHVDGDVAIAMRQYWRATRDRTWLRNVAWPVLSATADFWVSKAERGSDGRFHIRRVTTPDESAGLVDDSAWTMHVARANLEFAAQAASLLGETPRPAWLKLAPALQPAKDAASGLPLEHAGYRGETAKQADTLLLIHPGGLQAPPEQVARLYDYYAPRVIRNGPAMTDAIHAIVAARLGRGQEALARFRASYQPFLRPPFSMFSEKRTRDNLYFLTGAGGVLQAVIYGFAGLQLGDRPEPTASPCLPPGWQSITLRSIQWRGRAYDLRVDAAGAHWNRLASSGSEPTRRAPRR